VSPASNDRAFPPWYRLWAWLRSQRTTWFDSGRVGASRHPTRRAIRDAHAKGARLHVNLSQRPTGHGELLTRLGIQEVHIPVADLRPPSPEQLETAVRLLREAVADGGRALVHCDAGLGRTGTVVACYLVTTGLDARAAIAEVRSRRPGSVETYAQEAAVEAFAAAWRPG